MKRNWLVAKLGLVVSLGAAAAIAGCGGDGDPEPTGPSVEAICDKMCECQGSCDETYKKDCVREGEELEKKSDEGGCSDKWVEYKECLDENMTCTNASPDPGPCISFVEELDSCWQSTVDACAELEAEVDGLYEACGVATVVTPDEECTEARADLLECRIGCLVESPSCDAINEQDPEGAKALEECLSACEPMP